MALENSKLLLYQLHQSGPSEMTRVVPEVYSLLGFQAFYFFLALSPVKTFGLPHMSGVFLIK